MTDTNNDSRDNTPDGTPADVEHNDDAVQDAVIIDEPATETEHEELVIEDEEFALVEPGATPASVTEPEAETVAFADPVVAAEEPATVRTEAAPAAAPQQVVYVQAPAPPRKRGNRGVGTLIAVLSALVFVALLAVTTAIIQYASSGNFEFGFLAQSQFFIPVLFFLVAFILLVLLLNRAGWSAYIIGSLLVGLAVYFGSIGLGLLVTDVIANTPTEATARFVEQLSNPFLIASALLAREVSLWFGALISRRGRSVKARNVTARENYERELAERRAQG